MTHARRALVIALVLSGGRTVGAAPCEPRAALGGDAAAVARVAAELARLGDATETAPVGDESPPTSSCPVVVAAVELDRGGGIAVAVRDRSHRSEGRVVSDAALAAAWIDSWLRDDFAAIAATAPPSLAVDAIVAPAAVDSVFDRFAVAASFEQAWTPDRSRWNGVSVASCERQGKWCVGGRIRYATQDIAFGETAAARSDTSALATASLSQQVGTMSIAPEIGVGVGRLVTDRIEGCPPPVGCDPTTDGSCPNAPPPQTCTPVSSGPIYVGDNFHAATITPRAAAALRIEIPVFEHVWLEGLASVTLTAFGHTEDFLPGAMTPPGTAAPSSITLPGEPLAAFQLGIGLRVGAR